INLIATGIARLLTIFILLGMLVILSWKLTLLAVALILLTSPILKMISNQVLVIGKQLVNERHAFNSILFEIINGMKLIRQFSRENYMIQKYSHRVTMFNKALYNATLISQSVAPVFETTGIGILSIILIGGSFIVPHDNSAWIGILVTFIIILNRLIIPVKVLNQTIAQLVARLPYIQELDQFISDKNKEFVTSGTLQYHGLNKGIELRNIEFSYNEGENVILKEISFSIPKGSSIGIVGPSGSGKSTIIELIMRFYDPQQGGIYVNDINLKDIDLRSWRKSIGVVSQDTILFNDTIRANIAFTQPDAEFEKIINVSQRAHIHHFITTLPNGYDTIIGERGVLLSGGQRQRLAIARAILIDPEILIFDEATSALDTESEQIVQQAIDEIGKGKTVITIAHRLSTVRDSDMIIVMDDGRVSEKGTHKELLNNVGIYSKLVNLQSLSVT
ncbi:MAG: ATP-binding cassette domain-containing protein, partial [Elusimicrobia bacterium]|nr:ATP-binding cassette domain-containing protein [Elusimicrobiota bacterium]